MSGANRLAAFGGPAQPARLVRSARPVSSRRRPFKRRPVPLDTKRYAAGRQSLNRSSKVSNERRSQLLVPESELHGSLGAVLDIASARMRVMSRWVLKNEVKFVLNTTVDPQPVRERVVWAKRVGFRQHEVGLNFLQPSPELDTLIRCCSTVDGKVGLNPV